LLLKSVFIGSFPVSGHTAEELRVAADECRLDADKIRPYQGPDFVRAVKGKERLPHLR
jgi:hypothetical protein